jgi:hypothetical protein
MTQIPSQSKRRLGLIIGAVLLVPIVLFGLWTWITLSWSYSEGDRGGVLQKFSRKGWICKTYEGEVAQYVVRGMAPQIWYFTTRDDELAARLSKAVGQNIRLQYTEHRGVPTSCFGDTQYYARNFVVVNEQPPK